MTSVGADYSDIDRLLRDHARSRPDRPALTHRSRSLSWGALDIEINQAANALIARGVAPGDRVAVLASTSIAYVALLFGIGRAGACAVPLSTLAAPDALAAMVNDSEAKLLFVSRAYADLILPHAETLTGLVPGGRQFLDDDPDQSFRDFILGQSPTPPEIALAPDLGFNLIYSSGTTGTPKGILQSRFHRSRESLDIIAGFAIGPDSRTLVSTPLYSNTTLFLLAAVMAGGGSAVLMEKFDRRVFLELSERHRITHAVLVPVQYDRILADPDFERFDLSSYQAKFSTGAPLHRAVKHAILSRWPAGGLIEFYGMTEGGVSCTLVAHEHPDKLDTVGRPSPDCDLRIIGEDGGELPQGSAGEIVGRSPKMMLGYHNHAEAAREANWYDASGQRFHRSGDIGWIDEQGFVHLLDRKKDMIISGGFNVYAIDLERVLLEHPAVAEAAVIGAPSAEWGETPVGFVVASPSTPISAEDLRLWANDRVGKAQRISAVHILPELPRSPIGKVLKRVLRARVGEMCPA